MSGREDQRLHTAVLVDPAGERRKDRRARRTASHRLTADSRAAATAAQRAEFEALRADQKATTYLPASGEARSAALRTPGPLRLPRHQDTSATLAGAYPFLAEGGLGSQGVFVGQDLYSGASFVYDPWVLYSRGMITAPNIVLAGIVGSGKSSLVKSLYTRSIPSAGASTYPVTRRASTPPSPRLWAGRRSCSGTVWRIASIR